MSNLATAMKLAQSSLFVMPCNGKVPRLPSWQTRATNKPDGVRYYWEKYGLNSMPGIALGLCGLVVIDIDVKNGIDGCAALDPLLDANGGFPPCPVTITPSGGFHLFFKQPRDRAPLGNGTGALPPGIDVRGAVGQVIAPGAIRNDGTFYEALQGWPDLAEAFVCGAIPEIPEWLVGIIDQPKRTAPDCGPSGDRRSHARVLGDKSAWVAAALDQEARALAATTEGGRNNALNRFVYRFAGDAANEWTTRDEVYNAAQWACAMNGYLAGRDPSDGPKQFDKTFNSAWRGGFRLPTSGPRERSKPDPAFAARIQLTLKN